MRAPRNLLIAPDLSRDPRFILAECAMPTPRMFEPAHVFRGPRIGYGPSRVWLKTGADNRWAKKASTTRRVFRPTEMGCSPRPIPPSLRAPIPMYLSETPSIGWEAKTLGAKRRISSSEIATVPGTVDLVGLLFSAVLRLVDLGDWSCEPQQRGEALGAAEVFSTFGFGRKSMLGVFFEPKAKR